MGVKEIVIETLEVDSQGATAIEMGRYTLFADQKLEIDHGKYIVIWKLIKGDWKLHRDIWNTKSHPRAISLYPCAAAAKARSKIEIEGFYLDAPSTLCETQFKIYRTKYFCLTAKVRNLTFSLSYEAY